MKLRTERRWWRPGIDEIGYELWRLLRHYRWRIAAATVCLLLAKVATVTVPLLLKHIIEQLSQPRPLAALPAALLAGYALLRLAVTVFSELRDLLFAHVTHNTVAAYAHKTFAHVLALGARFHGGHQTGALLADIDRGTGGLAFLLGVGLLTMVPTLLEIGMVLTIMLSRYSGWFGAIIGLTFVLYGGFTVYFTQRRTVYQRRVNKLDTHAKGLLSDALFNYETIKSFANEKLEARRFSGVMAHWSEAVLRNQRALFVLHVGQSAIIALGVGAIMLLAGQAAWRGDMTVGDLVLVNAYVLQVCLPLNTLGFVYRECRDAWVNVERLVGLLREAPEIAPRAQRPPLRTGGGEVVFEGVQFHYDAQRPILQDISLRVAPGRVLAVVGGSGSGKSTLGRLLLRFHDPVGGRILIDGQDIRAVDLDSLRRAVGMVPQDTALFNDTIAYNIGYGRADASRDEVVAAARAAHLSELIESLPAQYDTPVGASGLKLSGGERQRIAVARAMLKRPAILVFDEATSALDAYSEHLIQRELSSLSRQRTTLIIAHRLSTIVHADEIVVLERGRIVERGRHADLLRQHGAYARLWWLQQRMEREREPGHAA